MKISTSYLYDRATDQMSSIQNRLSTSQAQMAETKQILSPSDSPDKAAAIQRLQGMIDRHENDSSTLKSALNRFKSEEVALQSTNDTLTRMKELAIQAASDTLSAKDRESIGAELKSLRQQLIALGNTQDDNGNYLFSGTRVRTPAFAEGPQGQAVYQGDQTQTRIPAGVDRTVQFTRAGTDVFSRVVRKDLDGNIVNSIGFFDSIDELISAVNSNHTASIQAGIQDLNQMHDNITLTQAQSGADQTVVQSQLDVMDQTGLRLKSSLSDIQDLDYSKAVTQMNKEMMALQAAMSSFSKISGLSLFDYVKG